VKLLVEHGADIWMKVAAYDCTAKDIACTNGFFDIYYYLDALETQQMYSRMSEVQQI
jgi:hypothetical protein